MRALSVESQPSIREIDDADLGGVTELWRAAGVHRPWNDPARDIAFARLGPHSTVMVAELDDQIVSTAMVGEDGHRGWVYYVAVDPAHQRQGLGERMMAVAERWLVGRGVWKVQILIREDNAAVQKFYERLGYKETRSVCYQKLLG